MSTGTLLRTRNTSKFRVQANTAYARQTNSAVPTAYAAAGSEAIICDSTQVALIDEIIITGRSKDSSANLTITIKMNGIELPFHITSEANRADTRVLHLRPMGNMVVQPGQTLAVKSSDAFSTQNPAGCLIRWRQKPLTAALRDGDILGQGTTPAVASTNAVAGAGTAAGVAKAIVSATAGYAVEVLGLYFTGSNYNAASDNIRIGFWDGTTGSFAANGSTIMRQYCSGGLVPHSKPIIIDDTAGCIQGPIGSGVYIQATANFAGATPTGDWVLVYRLVKATEVLSTTGTAGASPGGRRKWWCVTETVPSVGLGVGEIINFFAYSAGNTGTTGTPAKATCVILGHAGSCTAADDGSGVAGFLGIGIGSNGQTPLTEVYYVGGNMAAGTVSNSWGRDSADIEVNTDGGLGFIDNFATTFPTARTQLAFGMFGSIASSGLGGTKIKTIL